MKMVLKVLILANLFISAYASDVVRNGEGPAERNITFTYQRIEKLLDICLSSTACLNFNLEQNKSDWQLLKTISSHIDLERSNSSQLEFRSERQNPGFFKIDGVEKIAFTGDNVGDKIYINIDQIYFKAKNSQIRYVTVNDAVQLLVHEFGHHHGVSDHERLDRLGAIVGKFLESNFTETFHTPFVFDYSLFSLHGNSYEQDGELVLNTGEKLISLLDLFNKEKCKKSLLDDINPLTSSGKHFYNTGWIINPKNNLEGIKRIRGTMALMCGYKFQGNYTEYFDYEIEIDVSVSRDYKSFKLNKTPVLKKIKSLYTLVGGSLI